MPIPKMFLVRSGLFEITSIEFYCTQRGQPISLQPPDRVDADARHLTRLRPVPGPVGPQQDEGVVLDLAVATLPTD